MHRLLLGLHVFVGIGATVGGLAAIIYPLAPLGAPVEALRYSPFTSYLIPGIILFVIIGLGNVLSAYLLYRKSKLRGLTSHAVSWGLLIWIIVQCQMLRAVHFLHIIFLTIAIVQAAISRNIK